MSLRTGEVGFTSPISEHRFANRRRAAVELIATLALVISLIVAATAVSIGVARAQALRSVADGDGASVAIGVFFGFVLAAVGMLTAAVAEPR